MKYDVIIIGAGAAGLFSGLSIKNKNVIILEKNSRPGKKLLLSGAGQCNYTNNCSIDNFINKYGDKGRFVKTALYNFTNKDAMDFFKNHGVASIIREDYKVFPSSFNASDILDTLIKCCKENKTQIYYNEAVEKVIYDEINKLFLIETSKNSYACEKLVIATGGKSYTSTGSCGDGYDFAKMMKHKISEPRQALVPVYVENYKFNELSGISFENIKITLWRNNKKIKEFAGDLLFTHVNISGPVILNNSRYIENGDVLKINFTQFSNSEEFKKFFEKTVAVSGKLMVKTVLKQLDIPKRFIDKIIKLSGVDDDISCSQLDKNSRKKLIELLSCHAFKVEKLGDFNIAMVTKGGVSTDEINSKTMESKIVHNLYFAGEVIDFDGDTGGFNIQGAFSTGKLVADSITKIK
ncbi:MAG: NAD(P)/FAD-dependent oxidoreductase [Sedimentibacter sp.]